MPYVSRLILLLIMCLLCGNAFAQNKEITSLIKAKRLLQEVIYSDYFQTIYCNATYDPRTKKIIAYPSVFNETIIANRVERIEYEHVVPVSTFGQTFRAWQKGHKKCVSKGVPYKGRKCANKVNREFKLMQADMYNLYPSVGSVNAVRMDRPFVDLPRNIGSYFGPMCSFKVADNLAEPPDFAKGVVARAYLYFAETYPKRFRLTGKQLHQMIDWHIKYPVSQWECTRTARIEAIQHSENLITKEGCKHAGLWINSKENNNLNNLKQSVEKEIK